MPCHRGRERIVPLSVGVRDGKMVKRGYELRRDRAMRVWQASGMEGKWIAMVAKQRKVVI